MGRRRAGESGAPVSRAALGELLTRLRQVAVDGVVPEREFLQGVSALALSGDERDRLRDELARLGLLVRELPVHAEDDPRAGEKVVRENERHVTPRIAAARALLARYADASGHVPSRAVEGVVRLAGLDDREAARLRAGARVEPAADSAAEAPRATVTATADDAAGAAGGDLADAVAAALAVLEADRFERRPGKRLLSPEAEVGLAVLVRGGPQRIAREPDEEELKSLPRNDLRIRARDCLVVHNQGLVHSLARTMVEQGLDYEDLFQHGVIGLMRAARKFDPRMGNKFSTYATWWVRQSITRAIADEGALIRIPVHMHEQMRKVANAERSLAAQGRPATAADVAVACDLSLPKVEEIRRLSRRTDSLDRVVGDGATLADFVERARPLPSVEREVLGAMHVQEIMAVVNTFTGRDHRILVRRLGLDGDDPSTLDEVGREFGVSRERIRQLERKLRPELEERLRRARVFGVEAVPARTERDGAAVRAKPAHADGTRTRPTDRTPATPSSPATGAAPSSPAAPASPRPPESPVIQPSGIRSSSGTPSYSATPDTAAPPVSPATPSSPATPGAPSSPAALSPDAAAGERAGATAPAVAPADWDRARRLAGELSGQGRLAEYALAAMGHEALVVILGRPAADAVVRVARDREPADRQVLTALEVLRRVFDNVAEAGLRPEDFFDRPAEALGGQTPRTYLASRPLVHGESRLAVRDALREFRTAAPSLPREPERVDDAQETRREPQRAADAPAAPSPGVGAPRTAAADWDRALKLAQPPLGGGVAWLAEYALLALGHPQLSLLLGASAADAVVRAARQRGMLDRQVVRALEALRGVFDAVKELGLRPEQFFERPAEALAGASPRAYLAAKPLVVAESGLAVRDALREFVEAHAERTEPVPGDDGDDGDRGAGEPAAPAAQARPAPAAPPPAEEPAAEEPAVDADRLLAEVRARHEAALAELAEEHERRLREERHAAEARLAAVRAEGERQLDALEEALLNRADRSRERRERHVRRQSEEHLRRLKEQHREAYETVLRRAEHAEEAARRAAGTEQRVHELEQRLHEYRDGAEARIRDLESRLRQAEATAAERERAAGALVAELETGLHKAEAAVAQRDLFVEAARRRAEEAEQQAARRIAQSEHDAWLRVTELQRQLGDVRAQLAAAQEAAQNRTSLRDRWRRS
ncbi:sigma-70 family RNA polymerase sigma factor [Streptomyces griseicoloratus]|uniref:sigma-70 family RNA polymerase sigma factor n=1 Tax=Streptomyces griseicoloratus TaxID=2752516 RepID=UPI0028127AD4|nr:sigma-70 family RNA polymerase sigma factor [Streptomyces griseicoloratus]